MKRIIKLLDKDSVLQNKTVVELLMMKEELRVKKGIHIENDLGERGSMNHKTKPYFTCVLIRRRRIKSASQKNYRYNESISYETFDTYKEALIFGIIHAREMKAGLKV